MENIIIDLMENFGYIGIFLLIAVENIFPPIPSELILTFGGVMTTYTNLNIVIMIIFATLGALTGALALYYVGKIFNKRRLMKIVSGKVGKVLRLKAEDIEKADYWFDTKGHITVFFCRFIPIVRSLISIPAGMSEMPMKKFIVYTTLGTLIWNTVLVTLGSLMGKNWEKIVLFMNDYSHIVLIILVILFIVAIIYFYSKRVKKKTS